MISIVLLMYFVLHDIIPHKHPSEIYGTGIQAIFHGSDRKWWYLMLLAFIFVAVDLLRKWRLQTYLRQSVAISFYYLRIDISKLFNPILQALRTGILNPKLCD